MMRPKENLCLDLIPVGQTINPFSELYELAGWNLIRYIRVTR